MSYKFKLFWSGTWFIIALTLIFFAVKDGIVNTEGAWGEQVYTFKVLDTGKTPDRYKSYGHLYVVYQDKLTGRIFDMPAEPADVYKASINSELSFKLTKSEYMMYVFNNQQFGMKHDLFPFMYFMFSLIFLILGITTYPEKKKND